MPKDPSEPSVLAEHTCPLTGRRCHASQPARCERFWDCVRQALDRRVREKGQRRSPPPGQATRG